MDTACLALGSLMADLESLDESRHDTPGSAARKGKTEAHVGVVVEGPKKASVRGGALPLALVRSRKHLLALQAASDQTDRQKPEEPGVDGRS